MRIVNAKAAALALALAATTGSLLASTAAADAAAPRSPTPLNWGVCEGTGLDPRQECATLKVPMDYHDPGGDQISLAVSRISSAKPGARRGALLLIPGGPGGSGLSRPSTLGAKLPQTVRDAYDLVSFDPRGVGRSTPVSCGLAHEDLALTRSRPWPAPDGSIADNVATGRRMADACGRNGGPVLKSLSTVSEARDIDRIRQALGEEKLSAWGTSYGTYAGAVYAQMFPEHTDRWVLDSNDDPDPTRVGRGWLANFAVGVEDTFPAFAAYASRPGDHQLADTPDGVRRLFLDLAARLDAHPIPWEGANPPELNGNVLRQQLLDTLYAPSRYADLPGSRYAALAELIRAARDGADLPAPAALPDEAMQNTMASGTATLCNDVSWPKSLPPYAREVAASRTSHPLTAGMPVSVMPCAFWPDELRDKPVRITSDGPSNVLLVQNRRDPATPYSGALKLRRAFGERARMVTADETGHGAYVVNGNACSDGYVTDFLVGGERPERDTFCAAEGDRPAVGSLGQQ
ncbi:hydrolase [Streptomyces bingchenggensis BCW-1]|uniref:Hydrolase n=1 Tax=Streptomyces bingchenggensis (strain BCW-1) TaxID=749414 RepID=D7CHU3_STRBB|nr:MULTISPECIES: alpha/beta hydrolase [Streptomyces]ADI09143.1 hydrolase [Streptomyces bingchenggensis BCW-1]